MSAQTRCGWFDQQPALHNFHDHEWGEPIADADVLFEYAILFTFSVGIGLKVVLHKREHFRSELAGLIPERLALFGETQVELLLQNPRIIRNRRKIEASITNARAWLRLQEQLGSPEQIVRFFYDFVGGQPINAQRPDQVPPPLSIPQSEAMSKALKKRGFALLGPAMCYGLMQTAGLVNDHAVSCWRHQECLAMART